MKIDKFRIAWVRRNSVLFLDEQTGARFEAPIPGEARPNVPAYLRLPSGGPGSTRSGFSKLNFQEGLGLSRLELVKRPWVIVVPDDLQASEEAMLVNYGVEALGAKRVILAAFSGVVGPDSPEAHQDYISVTDTFRSCAVTYYNEKGEQSQRFLPMEQVDREGINAALDQLSPLHRPPVYVDDLEGTGRWDTLGTPVSLERALNTLRAGLIAAKDKR